MSQSHAALRGLVQHFGCWVPAAYRDHFSSSVLNLLETAEQTTNDLKQSVDEASDTAAANSNSWLA